MSMFGNIAVEQAMEDIQRYMKELCERRVTVDEYIYLLEKYIEDIRMTAKAGWY